MIFVNYVIRADQMNNLQNNLQKLGRLYQYFASCDWDHNNNELKIIAADNGFLIEIEFDYLNDGQLKVDFDYKFSDDDFAIEFKTDGGYVLSAFTYDFEKLDELLGKIFSEIIKTDIESLTLDPKINSNLRLENED